MCICHMSCPNWKIQNTLKVVTLYCHNLSFMYDTFISTLFPTGPSVNNSSCQPATGVDIEAEMTK